MEEAEVPLEQLHEHVHHTAEHSRERWISWVALSTAILAALAAIAGLLSGRHVNEAMMSQIEASDQWSYYQAKSIKASVLDAKMSLSGTASAEDRAKAARYEKQQEEIKSEAEHKEAAAKSNFHCDHVPNRDCGGCNLRADETASVLDRKFSFRCDRLRFSPGCSHHKIGALRTNHRCCSRLAVSRRSARYHRHGDIAPWLHARASLLFGNLRRHIQNYFRRTQI